MFFKNFVSPFRPFANIRKLNSKIPTSPHVILTNSPKESIKITQETVNQLERISLVDLGNKRGLERLQSAIEFASQINHVDTSEVEPMISVHEDRDIYLREDTVDDGNYRDDVMANAMVTEEEYFVAPPGNIPVTPRVPVVEEN